MTSFSLIYLSVYNALVLHLGLGSATSSSSPTVIDNSSNLAPKTTQSIAFSSALEIEASVSVQLGQLSSIPAVPLPYHTTDIPEYELVSRMALVLPPLPAGVNLPAPDEMVAKMMAASNNTANSGLSLVGR